MGREITFARRGKQPLTLRTPVMNAAGVLGYGDVFDNLYNLEKVGAIVTNPVTWNSRSPANGPRIIAKEGGVLLHTGLPNPGLIKVIRNYGSLWQMLKAPVIVHIVGGNARDVRRAAEKIEAEISVAAMELGLNDDIDWRDAETLVRAACDGCEKPVLVRLPFPGQADIARAVYNAGADAAVVTAPPRGTERDSKSGRLMRGRIYGSVVKSMTLRAVGQLARLFDDMPLVGSGGIHTLQDARDYIDAGAGAVQLDAAIWVEPWLFEGVSRDLAGMTVTRPTDAFPDEWYPGMGDTDAKARNLKK
jgi:dihydroorotate dehydrogenase (NAD+) catalytic subunit